jgi:MFS transporter, FHS family, glucose/mannose:H+ symporter
VPRLPAATPTPAALLGWLSFMLLGWSSMLVPSLIRSVRETFGQSDAGIGVYYLVFAVAYTAGSLGGGVLTERVGRRAVLTASGALLGAGVLGLGLAPSWSLFLPAGLVVGLGLGGIDGGVNGLFLDLFRTARGRALNLLHLFFSLGALSAPLAVGALVSAGVAWQAVVVASGLAALPVAVLFAVVRMPDGRHHGQARVDADPAAGIDGSARLTSKGEAVRFSWIPAGLRPTPGRLPIPLLLLGVAIASYVAAEVGVSNWLVRFLEPAPLPVATTALSLLWGGMTLGRLVAVRFADRFDHLHVAVASAVAMAVALAGAILVPSLPLSIALFAIAGFASGPVYPMIIALGGDRYPARSAAVSGFLSGTAITGSIVYPPIMGFMSVSVGLTVAMLGNVLLALATAWALLVVGRGRAAARRRRIVSLQEPPPAS